MECVVRIIDMSLENNLLSEYKLKISRTATISEIISLRVKKEVDDYNKKINQGNHMLVEPAKKEKTLNKRTKKRIKKEVINSEIQIKIALEAFSEKQYIVLVDDKQYENLEDKVLLNDNSKVSFIKLVPLRGG
ncbi:MAG: hypothetical protein ACFFAS_00185 [Promethearchaeota archaeon]